MTDAAELIAGDDLKAAALRFTDEMRARIGTEQQGLQSIFDSWFTRVLTRLIEFDPARSWEESVSDNAARSLHKPRACDGTCSACVSFSIAGGRDASWSSPGANGRDVIIIRGSAPSLASTFC